MAAPEGASLLATDRRPAAGILPTGQSRHAPATGYAPPMHGTGPARPGCGQPIRAHACTQARLDVDGGHAEEIVSNWCGRMVCRVCSPKAVRRAAKRSAERLAGVRDVYLARAPRHFALSPPQTGPESWAHRFRSAEDQDEWEDVERRFRRKCRSLLRKTGLRGGAMIIHAYRCTMKCGGRERYRRGELYVSPHVHVVAWGAMRNSRDFYRESRGWVYANLDARLHRERDSIEDTIDYVLHHATRSPNVVTYWGCASTYYVVIDREHVDVAPIDCEAEACDRPVYVYPLREDGSIDWWARGPPASDRSRRRTFKRAPPRPPPGRTKT